MDIRDPIKGVETLIVVARDTPAPAVVTAVGLLLLCITIVLCVAALKSDPKTTPLWLKLSLFICLLFGIAFSAIGSSAAIFIVSEKPIRVAPETAFQNLKTNERASWLIRLVSYDPQQQAANLAVGKIKDLGPTDQQYTFVAPYNELIGYTAADAVRMLGGTVGNGEHVSAIVFPLPSNIKLFPANARGLLQVVQRVETAPGNQISHPLLAGTSELTKDELTDLQRDEDLFLWSWDYYKKHYPRYCEIAHKFRCQQDFTARNLIGHINVDWHPLGFAMRGVTTDNCETPVDAYCGIKDWQTAVDEFKSKFGARIFLMRNMPLASIADAVLIDFGKPSQQIVPDIGIRAKDLSSH